MTDLAAIIRPIVEGQIKVYLHAHPDNVLDHKRAVSGIGKRVTHDICAPETVRRIELALRGAGCGCGARAKEPDGETSAPLGMSRGGQPSSTSPESELLPGSGLFSDASSEPRCGG